MTRPDFEESRQMAAEACTEVGADPDRIGCGPRGKGLGPLAWLLVGLLSLVAMFGIAHFAARFF